MAAFLWSREDRAPWCLDSYPAFRPTPNVFRCLVDSYQPLLTQWVHLLWGTRTFHHASYSFESLVDDTKLCSNSGRNTVGDRSHNLWLQVERPVSVKKQLATHRSPASLLCVPRKESYAPVMMIVLYGLVCFLVVSFSPCFGSAKGPRRPS